MKTAIIISKKDQASLNIKDCLLKRYNFKGNNGIYTLGDISIYTIEEESIYADNIDKKIKADLFIFATKHESTSKVKTLSTHPIGNFGEAEFGGKDNTLCKVKASYIKKALVVMNELNDIGYEVVQEISHHGPILSEPAIFIEVGSSKKEWINKRAGNIIAETIFRILKDEKEYKAVIGVGGLHYCPNFNKISLNSKYAVSHVCPKYHLQNLNENLLKQMIETTEEEVKFIVLDWKGLGQYKQKVLELVEKSGLPYERTQSILKERK